MQDSNLFQQIEQAGQGHLLQFWNDLSEEQKQKFADQLKGLDWDLISSYQPDQTSAASGSEAEARRAVPPSHLVRVPTNEQQQREWKEARPVGEAALRAGKVAAVLLAGGQGTRLGFKHSKGLFPIGPVTGKSLLEILATQVVALSEKYECSIPYFVMTSDGTHQEIEDFYKKNNYFGLNPDNVFLFHQGYAPSLDSKTGKVLLADKGSLSLNPDGHGGIISALWKSGLFETMKSRGIEYLFSHQVDNPLAKVCDPEFIGLHIKYNSEVSTKVVSKTGPEEKVGVAVDIDGHTRIIEYIDLPQEMAKMREADGQLRFWAGSTAIHLFNRSFLERVATSKSVLPWHRAIKKIPYVDASGNLVTPDKENGVKFERFIFDTLPLAKVALIVETLRDDEFAPLKNKEGEFSADYVKNRMVRVATRWLKQCGVQVPDGVAIEISPQFALTAEDVATRLPEISNLKIDQPLYLSPSGSNSSRLPVEKFSA